MFYSDDDTVYLDFMLPQGIYIYIISDGSSKVFFCGGGGGVVTKWQNHQLRAKGEKFF